VVRGAASHVWSAKPYPTHCSWFRLQAFSELPGSMLLGAGQMSCPSNTLHTARAPRSSICHSDLRILISLVTGRQISRQCPAHI
jgi:hypothetical protein